MSRQVHLTSLIETEQCKHSASSEQIIPTTSSNKISLGGAEEVTKSTGNSIVIDNLSSMFTYAIVILILITIILLVNVIKQ